MNCADLFRRLVSDDPKTLDTERRPPGLTGPEVGRSLGPRPFESSRVFQILFVPQRIHMLSMFVPRPDNQERDFTPFFQVSGSPETGRHLADSDGSLTGPSHRFAHPGHGLGKSRLQIRKRGVAEHALGCGDVRERVHDLP